MEKKELDVSSCHELQLYRARKIMFSDTNPHTAHAHLADIIYLQAWLDITSNGKVEDITLPVLINFILDHIEGLPHHVDEYLVNKGLKMRYGTHKISTVSRRLASLSVYLQYKNKENICCDPYIRRLMQKLTKKHGGSKPKSRAITKNILNDLLDTCRGNTLSDLRDAAILLFGWGSGGRRVSEIVSAECGNLQKCGEDEYTYTVTRSKTDQTGKGHTVPVKGRVAHALTRWLEASGITSGLIFRAVRHWNTKIKGKLCNKDVARMIRKRLALAGYNPNLYSTHGLRSGFVTEAGRQSIHINDVMQLTNHKTVQNVLRYYQSGSILQNRAAQLAD